MKVFDTENFSVSIHELDHPPPHCHVRFPDQSEVCVMIPLLEPMYGATISKAIREALLLHLDDLACIWDELHPIRKQKKIKSKKSAKSTKKRKK